MPYSQRPRFSLSFVSYASPHPLQDIFPAKISQFTVGIGVPSAEPISVLSKACPFLYRPSAAKP